MPGAAHDLFGSSGDDIAPPKPKAAASGPPPIKKSAGLFDSSGDDAPAPAPAGKGGSNLFGAKKAGERHSSTLPSQDTRLAPAAGC